ncbi:MAG: hypothetical protein Roseis2KO_27470 [Roseivirga sp.]
MVNMKEKHAFNQFALKSMQQRVECIKHRKGLITKVKESRKALVILRLQVKNLEQKPLTDICKNKRQELNGKARELEQYVSEYLRLAKDELDILKHHLEETIRLIESSETLDPDIEDRRFSLQYTIWSLQQEIHKTMK